MSVQVELARFIARFDAGEYWAAHEELEPAWLRDRDPALKGLIQTAAAMLHVERGNLPGARRKAESALRLLGDDDRVEALPLQPLRDALKALLAMLQTGSPEPVVTGVMPSLGALLDVDAELPELEPHELPYRVRRYEEGYRIGRDPALRDPS